MCEIITPALAEVIAALALLAAALTSCVIGADIYWRHRNDRNE